MKTPITAYCVFPGDANPSEWVRKVEIGALDTHISMVMVREPGGLLKRVNIRNVFWTFGDAKAALQEVMIARAELACSETEAATRRQVCAEECLKLANEFKEPN